MASKSKVARGSGRTYTESFRRILAMLLAIVDGEKVYASKGLTGICPGCHMPVIPKCGPLKIDHWAHKVGNDCDSWSEHVGPWHLSWQNMLRRDCIEVPHGTHRADVV